MGGVRSWRELDDPQKDGWQSEAFHERTAKQLKTLGALIQGAEKIDAAACSRLAAGDFHCGSLRPKKLHVVFEDKAVRVERAATVSSTQVHSSGALGAESYRGVDGLAAALRALAEPFRGATDVRAKFKTFDVELQAELADTRQYLSVSGRTAQGMLELHATWTTTWTRPAAPDASPHLTSIRLDDFQQVRTRGDQGTLFSDCTPSVLSGTASYRSQLLRGYNYWISRSQDTRYLSILGNPGLTVGDVNGDALEDLYVCQEAGLPNLLLLGRPDGTVEDASDRWGVNWLRNTRAALLVDWDNDGDEDLAAAITGGVILASNEGQRFKIQTLLPTGDDTMNLCAADYDNDGRVDLYVCAHTPDRITGADNTGLQGTGDSFFVYHDANDGERNSLFRNLGDWQFRDVTAEVGLDVNNRRYTLAASWEDFDNDGDQDLYVANDFGRNNLYRNDAIGDGRRRFVDVAASAGVEDSASGMSVTWGDYDLDGWMDLYVSNMFSAAGNRVTSQQQFKSGAPEEDRKALRRFARGNTLLRNRGDGSFRDQSVEAGVTMGRWAWSSLFFDLNNDGWQDLLVANGYVTSEATGDL